EDANFTEMRSTLDYLMQSLNCGDAFEVKPGKKGTYINGRCGFIYLNGKIIGEIGEIHPEVILNFKLEFPVAAFEIILDNLISD
ncbi:MAG: phenylalanine--tRNA ligase subunit beta, partial [Promethearchaeota archaeon]